MPKAKKTKAQPKIIFVMKIDEGTAEEWSAIESDYKEFDLSDNLPHKVYVYELKKVLNVVRKVEIVAS